MIFHDGIKPRLRKNKGPVQEIEWYGMCSVFGLSDLIFLSDIDQGKDGAGNPLPARNSNFKSRDVLQMLRMLLPQVMAQNRAEARKRGLAPEDVIYRIVCDNAKWHDKKKMAKIAKEFGVEMEFKYPTYSSDLNVVEGVWNSIKSKVRGRILYNLKEAKVAVQEAYKEVLEQERTEHTYANACERYVERLQACAKRVGGKTRY